VKRLLRTITAPCMELPFGDLIVQTCASTFPVTVTELAQLHLELLDVIGFVLP
jgi:hypothetical protein